MIRAVDLHSHFFPQTWPDFAVRFGGDDWPWLKRIDEERAIVMVGSREFRPITAACWDAERRLADMDRDGVDVQVICATPVLFGYHRPVAQALYCAQYFNDALLELVARGRGRFLGLCQVPLQDTDVACRELSRAMRAGCVGVQIGNHVGERDLDDEAILTFLAHCAAEGALVLVHPWDMLGGARTARWMLGWTVAMPAETHLSIASLVLGGGFDHLPRSLRIVFAHGGGSFPWLLGRMDNAWHRRDAARGRSQRPPRAYVERFAVDSAVFDPAALRYLVETMGEERVLLGSDYPFPLGEERVGALVRGCPGLPEAVREKILARNAIAWLGLDERGLAPEAAAA